jgi:hypothetical protein
MPKLSVLLAYSHAFFQCVSNHTNAALIIASGHLTTRFAPVPACFAATPRKPDYQQRYLVHHASHQTARDPASARIRFRAVHS